MSDGTVAPQGGVMQSMIQSHNAEKSRHGDDGGLNPVALGNFTFDVMSHSVGSAETAFVSPLAKLEGIMPSVEANGLIGVDLISKLKEALAQIYGQGMPHTDYSGMDGSDMHDAIEHYGRAMRDHGVDYGGHVENHLIGGLHPDQVAQLHQNYGDQQQYRE